MHMLDFILHGLHNKDDHARMKSSCLQEIVDAEASDKDGHATTSKTTSSFPTNGFPDNEDIFYDSLDTIDKEIITLSKNEKNEDFKLISNSVQNSYSQEMNGRNMTEVAELRSMAGIVEKNMDQVTINGAVNSKAIVDSALDDNTLAKLGLEESELCQVSQISKYRDSKIKDSVKMDADQKDSEIEETIQLTDEISDLDPESETDEVKESDDRLSSDMQPAVRAETPTRDNRRTPSAKRRRKSADSKGSRTASSSRSTHTTCEKLQKVKDTVERAIREHKTFCVQGTFPTIREAMKQRGWIEKETQRCRLTNSTVSTSLDDGIYQNNATLCASFAHTDMRSNEAMVAARLLRNVKVDFLWTMRSDPIDWQETQKKQIINRFPRAFFTTKVGLCAYLQQVHWFCETGVSHILFPRCYNVCQPDELSAFMDDFRLTACLGLLKWLVNKYEEDGESSMKSVSGKVPFTAVEFALKRCEEYMSIQAHDDIDKQDPICVWDHQWDQFLTWYYLAVHDNCHLLECRKSIEALYESAKFMLHDIRKYWPQIDLDGTSNIWIVKPGAKSRGRGIQLTNKLDKVMDKVSPAAMKEARYVVQKYIERPLLIYNTKFDIRQWFLVTCAQPLTIWMYKESYLRFCSQPFDLKNMHESVHLCNNAVQCKYKNAKRNPLLPDENMWDCYTFQTYLRGIGHADMWDKCIYPGMRESIICALLASQEHMDQRRNCFELFGADFMLTEDFLPWLIEINSCPCMQPSTSVTARMCSQCLEDVIKVVIDKRFDRRASTGMFELVYRQHIPRAPPYLGMSLSIRGKKLPNASLLARARIRSANRARMLRDSSEDSYSSGSELCVRKKNSGTKREQLGRNSKMKSVRGIRSDRSELSFNRVKPFLGGLELEYSINQSIDSSEEAESNASESEDTRKIDFEENVSRTDSKDTLFFDSESEISLKKLFDVGLHTSNHDQYDISVQENRVECISESKEPEFFDSECGNLYERNLHEKVTWSSFKDLEESVMKKSESFLTRNENEITEVFSSSAIECDESEFKTMKKDDAISNSVSIFEEQESSGSMPENIKKKPIKSKIFRECQLSTQKRVLQGKKPRNDSTRVESSLSQQKEIQKSLELRSSRYRYSSGERGSSMSGSENSSPIQTVLKACRTKLSSPESLAPKNITRGKVSRESSDDRESASSNPEMLIQKKKRSIRVKNLKLLPKECDSSCKGQVQNTNFRVKKLKPSLKEQELNRTGYEQAVKKNKKIKKPMRQKMGSNYQDVGLENNKNSELKKSNKGSDLRQVTRSVPETTSNKKRYIKMRSPRDSSEEQQTLDHHKKLNRQKKSNRQKESKSVAEKTDLGYMQREKNCRTKHLIKTSEEHKAKGFNVNQHSRECSEKEESNTSDTENRVHKKKTMNKNRPTRSRKEQFSNRPEQISRSNENSVLKEIKNKSVGKVISVSTESNSIKETVKEMGPVISEFMEDLVDQQENEESNRLTAGKIETENNEINSKSNSSHGSVKENEIKEKKNSVVLQHETDSEVKYVNVENKTESDDNFKNNTCILRKDSTNKILNKMWFYPKEVLSVTNISEEIHSNTETILKQKKHTISGWKNSNDAEKSMEFFNEWRQRLDRTKASCEDMLAKLRTIRDSENTLNKPKYYAIDKGINWDVEIANKPTITDIIKKLSQAQPEREFFMCSMERKLIDALPSHMYSLSEDKIRKKSYYLDQIINDDVNFVEKQDHRLCSELSNQTSTTSPHIYNSVNEKNGTVRGMLPRIKQKIQQSSPNDLYCSGRKIDNFFAVGMSLKTLQTTHNQKRHLLLPLGSNQYFSMNSAV